MLMIRHFIKKNCTYKALQTCLILNSHSIQSISYKNNHMFPDQGAAILDGVWQPPIRTWKFGIFSTLGVS